MYNGIKNNQTAKFNYDDLVLPFLIFAMVSPFFGLFTVYFLRMSFDNVGTYGDFIGGSTIPFLTSITILYIYKTNNLQREQLEVQKSEFTLLQQEVKSTTEALQDQSKTNKMQRFENSFFIQINELRNANKEITKSFNQNIDSYTEPMTFEEIMTQIMGNINDKRSEELGKSFDKLHAQKKQNSIEGYYDLYKNLLSNAIDESGIYRLSYFNTFFNIIERSLQVIYHYKNFMDEWEFKFYSDYLYKEITSEGINLVLFDICLHSNKKELIKELKFDKYANVIFYNSSREDFRLLNYLLYGKPIIE